MKKILIFVLLLINLTILFGIKIVSFSDEILNGEFLSMNNTQLFFKIDKKFSNYQFRRLKILNSIKMKKKICFFH